MEQQLNVIQTHISLQEQDQIVREALEGVKDDVRITPGQHKTLQEVVRQEEKLDGEDF